MMKQTTLSKYIETNFYYEEASFTDFSCSYLNATYDLKKYKNLPDKSIIVFLEFRTVNIKSLKITIEYLLPSGKMLRGDVYDEAAASKITYVNMFFKDQLKRQRDFREKHMKKICNKITPLVEFWINDFIKYFINEHSDKFEIKETYTKILKSFNTYNADTPDLIKYFIKELVKLLGYDLRKQIDWNNYE